MAERRFLAALDHPNIVRIHNFVAHEGAGYIVMDYIGGKSLKAILADRRDASGGRNDPMPVDRAIAYTLGVLPAMGYFHAQGLLYCDMKPDNVMLSGDTLKIIDLGGVRHIDDEEAAIYGTLEYQAPEVAETGPTVASDLYTVGRMLAVLLLASRLSEHLLPSPARAGRGTAVPPPRVAVPLRAQGDRGPDRPVRVGRRDGRAAGRRPSGGSGGPRGRTRR